MTDEELIKSNIEKYGYASWYDFCVNEWGTKWDTECHSVDIYEEHPDTLEAVFDTAWAPPIQFYEKLERFDLSQNRFGMAGDLDLAPDLANHACAVDKEC